MPGRGIATRIDPFSIAAGFLAAAMVYVTYYPSDSVAVEKGDALWFGVMGIVIASIVWSSRCWLGWNAMNPSSPSGGDLDAAASPAADRATPELADATAARSRQTSSRASRMLDFVPWLLAGWMMLAAFATSPPGNLRMATNEAWFWVTAAAVFTSTRRLMVSLPARRAVLVLLVVCVSGLAVHGLHQYFVSLPANRAEYQQDPERVLALAGMDAPSGSAERMVFENRLFDGGPTGTFALANSLAAVLLVGVVVAVGVLRFQWHHHSRAARFAWAGVAVLCAGCLMAARSRSASLAMFVALALLLVASSRVRGRNPKTLLVGLGGVSLAGIVVAIFVALRGNREWFEEAPASLAFRFQYWRSTWQLILDQPLFAAGPGNFQSIYERYREASATEQIAEPHNLFVETLASGGFVGLGLLLVIMIAGLIVVTLRIPAMSDAITSAKASSQKATHDEAASATAKCPQDDRDRWLWLGAILSLAMIWLLSWASRHPPDLQASLFVLPTVLVVAMVLRPSVAQLDGRDIDSIVGVALIAVCLHMMVAGGWTVPGVAMLVWVTAGILTRTADSEQASTHGETLGPASLPSPRIASRAIAPKSIAPKSIAPKSIAPKSIAPKSIAPKSIAPSPVSSAVFAAVFAGVGLALLLAIYLMSLRPVEQQQRLMATAAMAQSTGQRGKALVTLELAVESDPWSPDAGLWLADYYRWKIILEPDSPAARRQWEANLALAKQRAGDDPAVYRMIGAQQLHVYQRHGRATDLDAAAETFAKAVQWSPANQWMLAQMAVVAIARGDNAEAARLGASAAELSQLGGNIERALWRQQVYVAAPLGREANRGPVRRPADQLLPEPNAGEYRTGEHERSAD